MPSTITLIASTDEGDHQVIKRAGEIAQRLARTRPRSAA